MIGGEPNLRALEDRRFEAALRLFVAQVSANMDSPGRAVLLTTEAVAELADTSVAAADMLLIALRREK